MFNSLPIVVTLSIGEAMAVQDAAKLAAAVHDRDWEFVVAWMGACGGDTRPRDAAIAQIERAVRPEIKAYAAQVRETVARRQAEYDQDIAGMTDEPEGGEA